MTLIPIGQDNEGFVIAGPGLSVYPANPENTYTPNWARTSVAMNDEGNWWSKLTIDEIRSIILE